MPAPLYYESPGRHLNRKAWLQTWRKRRWGHGCLLGQVAMQ